jgi:hypothetical protein
MNWSDEPATENQLSARKRFGQPSDRLPPKTQGPDLVGAGSWDPSTAGASGENGVREIHKHSAHLLRVAVESARQIAIPCAPDKPETASGDLASAIARRQAFWMDTCRDPTQMQDRSVQILDLYMKYGCRFVVPTHEQVQEVLDALDAAMALWDRDHQELFYQTLELNFPELRRHL